MQIGRVKQFFLPDVNQINNIKYYQAHAGAPQ
jgi:hypothetical protein